MTPHVSIVLGSYNRRPFLKKTIENVRNNGVGVPYEIIVVDGGSTDGSLRYLVRQKDVITIIQHNRGTWRGKPVERRSWGYFMNIGFQAAHGKYICMISDDCLLIPGSIQRGHDLFEELRTAGRRIAAVAFYWREWPADPRYRVGLTFGRKMFVNHGMYLREALADVGWIEEYRYRFYHADGDLCLKLWQAGYEVVDCGEAFVEHYRHANSAIRQSNLETQKQDEQAYREAWSGIYYNPEKPDAGAWVSLDFDDPHDTARGFRWPYLWSRVRPVFLCRRMLSRLKRAVLGAARPQKPESKTWI
jgi:glycosyltransferase involved in cell wall biosynthesis